MSSQQAQNRYPFQQRQEDRSINQFRDRMHEFGWLPERAERDVGEDLIVRILTNSQPVGIPFYAQLKSVIDLLDRKKGNSLVYRLEVADLLRWESSSVPVVLFVWDIILREGKWATIRSLIQLLDKRNPQWRKQKTITVHLPWGNTTADEGLRLLRTEVGHMLYPLIAADKSVEINVTVSLPYSDETVNDRIQLERFFREGTPVTIDGRYIKQMVFSEWWAEWFADQDLEIRKIEIYPRPHPEPQPVSIMVFSTGHPIVNFPDVELQLIRSGTDMLVFSNEHQNGLINFTFSFPKGTATEHKGNMTFHVNRIGYNILETREVIRFQQAVLSGGRLSILLKKHGGVALYMEFQPPFRDRASGIDLSQRYIDLVEILCFVQEHSGYLIRLPDGDIEAKDIHAAYELKEILQNGRTIVQAKRLSFTTHDLGMLKKLYELHRDADSENMLMIHQEAAESHVVLFDQKIQVGPMTKTIVGTLDVTAKDLEEYIQRNDSAAAFELRLAKVEITEKFANWQRAN